MWCGEPEKVAEAPKVEIPQSIRTVLENYDKQVEVEKQKYLTLMEKLQKDLKTKLEAEVKTATRNKKDDLVTVLTDKLKELDENKVEVGFLGLGFPGEAKKMNRKMLEDILTSRTWVEKDNPVWFWTMKNGVISAVRKGKVITEKNGKVFEEEKIVEGPYLNSYKIDIEKGEMVFTRFENILRPKITEKELVAQNGFTLIAVLPPKK
jgi:hypothetical protein